MIRRVIKSIPQLSIFLVSCFMAVVLWEYVSEMVSLAVALNKPVNAWVLEWGGLAAT